MEWFLKVFRDNYANFNGRARRKEYWMFFLFNTIFALFFMTLYLIAIFGEITYLETTSMALIFVYVLAILIPSIAVSVRRLHDTNKSGWLYLISFIPFGSFILFVFMVIEGDRGANQYGEDPKNPNLEMEDNLIQRHDN